MRGRRLFRHLLLPHWWVMRVFPANSLSRIGQAVVASESSHRGELRVVVEANLPLPSLWQGKTARARAIELFSQLRVWDTAENSGVLIYLQLIDRRVEIVADRGIHAKVGPEFWDATCRRMEAAFRDGDFEGGTLFALASISQSLSAHFAANGENLAELPDAPLVL